MKLILSSCGNPDHRQDPNKPLYGALPDTTVEVKSFKEASEKAIEFIVKGDLGSGNWNGGQILDDTGKEIAQVSYNGRVWHSSKDEPWHQGTEEIKI